MKLKIEVNYEDPVLVMQALEEIYKAIVRGETEGEGTEGDEFSGEAEFKFTVTK